MTARTLTIRQAGSADLPMFFAYLGDHLSDNGVDGTALFMPMARGAALPAAMQAAFRLGVDTPQSEPGWRRLWLALTDDGEIAGHIDLRARPQGTAAHRALLGMGVQRGYRRQGLGARLIAAAVSWAHASSALTWIDLEVLSVNAPARQLYARAGFVQTGEVADMFRIDGEQLGETYMSRRIR